MIRVELNMIGTKDTAILRRAQPEDMPRIDEITIVCYTAIQESWVAMQGYEIYRALNDPDKNWEERKTGQNRELFAEHPEWVWVLELDSQIFGFVTFKIIDIVAGKKLGIIENNGVLPEYTGMGWGKFMYRHVLNYFRDQGLIVAFVETGLDDPHISARKAYEAVGFDRMAPVAYYWQDLLKNNLGSTFEEKRK
jgi:ribosomal protein S18 acetylase RimI-like enzyme